MTSTVGFRSVHFQILEVRNVRKGLVSQDVYVRTRLVPLMAGAPKGTTARDKGNSKNDTVRLDIFTSKKTNTGQDLGFHEGFSFSLPVFHLVFDLWKTRALKEDKVIGTFVVSLEDVARAPNMCYSGWHETKYPAGTKRAGQPSGKVFVAIQLEAPPNLSLTPVTPPRSPGVVSRGKSSQSFADTVAVPVSPTLYPNLDEPPTDHSFVFQGGTNYTAEGQPYPTEGLYSSYYGTEDIPKASLNCVDYYPSSNPYLLASAPPVDNA
ncbi:hypothetical protein GpartN1_g5638.t1 [Galdieria partita]|uniref:C2 domain-containing protein n=1 Tax=Galdieria partita TaxID=83374 RepID=A0A9C7Q1K0_9RHOD|nr:hypothetical protein GpartN1_g5638.t1 [Galdieria partita]